MANVRISDLTAATAANAAMQIEVNDAGTSKSVTVAQIATVGGQTTVNDVAYTVLATDINVQYTALTAARIVSLPAASGYAAGREITIGDAAGACSATNTITVTANGTDRIDGAVSVVLGAAYAQLTLQSKSGGWVIIAQQPTISNITGRMLLVGMIC